MFDDNEEHANTYLHTYLYLLRYMYLLAQLRELLGMYLYLYLYLRTQVWTVIPRPELHKCKNYKVMNKFTRTQLPYLSLLPRDVQYLAHT